MRNNSIFSLLVVLFTISAALSMTPALDGAASVDEPLELRLEAKERDGHVFIEVIFINKSLRAVTLNKQLLNPVIIIKASLADGTLVPNYPPSIPRPLSNSDLLELEPSAIYGFRQDLDGIFDGSGFREIVRLKCIYDTSDKSEQSIFNFWRGRIESNEIIVRLSPQD